MCQQDAVKSSQYKGGGSGNQYFLLLLLLLLLLHWYTCICSRRSWTPSTGPHACRQAD
jgi:hypothetical protein